MRNRKDKIDRPVGWTKSATMKAREAARDAAKSAEDQTRSVALQAFERVKLGSEIRARREKAVD